MSRFLALCSDQSAVYRRDLGEVIVRRAGVPLRRKPRRQDPHCTSTCSQTATFTCRSSVLLICTGRQLYRDYGESPAVKTRYRLLTTVSRMAVAGRCTVQV